jgi:hypothetical protein
MYVHALNSLLSLLHYLLDLDLQVLSLSLALRS